MDYILLLGTNIGDRKNNIERAIETNTTHGQTNTKLYNVLNLKLLLPDHFFFVLLHILVPRHLYSIFDIKSLKPEIP